MFTGRFGPGAGEVLFDRVLRENGIRHLLTAPRSPTTTGKVERFHKTVKAEFLAGKVFGDLEEAQAQLDGWVEAYNTERPHQGIGMVPPVRRFELVVSEPFQAAPVAVAAVPEPAMVDRRQVTRKVGTGGRISLATHKYPVGRWLAGETVDVEIRDDGLIEISHRGVLVVSHVRQHPVAKEPPTKRQQRTRVARRARPPTVGRPVVRKVDGSGAVSFAGVTYRAGRAYRRQQVQVRVVGDTVEISKEGRVIATHAVKHDPRRVHGALANPGGRPNRINAAS